MKPFSLLTYALIAIIVAGLAITLMMQFFPQEDVFDKIRDSLEISQNPSQLGKYVYTGKIQVQKDLIITKTALNISNYSVAVECNDPNRCCPIGRNVIMQLNGIIKKYQFKRDESLPIYTRCGPYYNELVCRVYFGKKNQAQAKIN